MSHLWPKPVAKGADARAARLGELGPDGWFDDHLDACVSGCVDKDPADACDLGEALFRLGAAALAGKLDRRPLG